MRVLAQMAEGFVKEALSRGFSEAAALLLETRRTMVKIANSQPSVIQSWVITRAGVYLAKGKKIYVGEVPVHKPEDLSRVIERAGQLLAKLPDSELYAPLPEPTAKGGLAWLADRKVAEAVENPAELAHLILEASSREHRVDFVAGKVDVWVNRKALATSSGAALEEESTGLEAYVRAFKGEGSGQWAVGSRVLDAEGVERASLMASRLAHESQRRKSVEPGVYDVVLSPLVFAQLINVIGWMATGFSILSGMSIFIDKKPGEVVASEKLTLVDAPRDPKLPRSTGFDDEGVETYDKPIIERGVFRGPLHNAKTASKLGGKTTGNAGWIEPRPWNLVIQSGDMTLDEMVRETKRGLLVTNNWYTRLQNYADGTFSTIGRDAIFLIEKGEIAGAVERVRIADKLPRLLSNIEGLTKEAHDVMWWEVWIPTRAPYALVRDVNITKHTL